MTWVITIAGICALIVLHEFGHFAAAKAVGMRVERFSLFFPPKIVGVRRGETEYMIGAIPAGGYVRITGMNQDELTPSLRPLAKQLGADKARVEPGGAVLMRVEGAWRDVTGELSPQDIAAAIEDDRRGYFNQPVWKRVVVIAAGPAVNILIAFVIFWAVLFGGSLRGDIAIANLTNGAVNTVTANTSVAAVTRGSAAAGELHSGDRIVGIDGRRVSTESDVVDVTKQHTCAGGARVQGCRAATPVTLTVRNAGTLRTITVYPTYDKSVGRMLIGFEFGYGAARFGPVAAAGTSLAEIWHVTTQTLTVFGRSLTSSKERGQLHSIVGITDVTQQAVASGAPYGLVILGFVSLALGVINLFPFLPLDGGHIVWAVAEKVRGRPISALAMARYSSVGVVLIIFLVISGLSNDISQLTGSGLH